LLVEDDVDVANLTSSFLAIAGFDVRVAENAEQASEQMESNSDFTLLLSDVVLPGGKNGAQVARDFQQRFPGARVIFMSGYTENAIIDQGVVDEDFVLLNKPFTRAELMEKILDAIEAEDSEK
jgi:DNA-binding NtrC family response regulator